jgi:hypothetical protein
MVKKVSLFKEKKSEGGQHKFGKETERIHKGSGQKNVFGETPSVMLLIFCLFTLFYYETLGRGWIT